MNYGEKLLDPRWQRKRLDILNRDGFCCKDCLDSKNTLHVHHLAYLPNKEPWDHPDHYLITLCKNCHYQLTTALKTTAQEVLLLLKLNLQSEFYWNALLYVLKNEPNVDMLVYALWEAYCHSGSEAVHKALHEPAYGKTDRLIALLEANQTTTNG